MEAEVARPGLVADQRDAARVRDLGDAGDVRDDAEPRRLDEQDRARVRLGRERGLDRLDRDGRARRRAPRRPQARSTPAATPRARARPRPTCASSARRSPARPRTRPRGRAPGWDASSRCPRSGRGRRRRRSRRAPRRARGSACRRAVVGAAVHRRVVREQRIGADQRAVALVAGRRERRRASRRNASTASAKGVSGSVTRETLCELCEVQQQQSCTLEAHADRSVPRTLRPGAQPVPQSGALSQALSVTSGRGSLPSAFMTKTSARPPAAAVLKMIWLPSGE